MHDNANPANPFQDIVAQEQGLQRRLSGSQMSMIAIGGAIGTGLFMGSGFAIGFAGPSVLISYAIGAVIALLLMGCLAEMTVAHPTSGSFGAYAGYYVTPWAGFMVRYAYWASIVLAVGTEVTAVALYMQYWFPQSPAWVWIVLFSAALIGVNALSVNVFGVIEYGFSMIKIVAIVGFILLGAYIVYGAPADSQIGLRNYVEHGGFFPKGYWGCWVAVIVSIFSYLSIEMIAVAAGEAKEPEKAITQAFRAAMLRLVVFYLLTLALMLAILPWTAAGTDKSPFVLVMEAIHIAGAPAIINFVVLVAALSAMNSQLYITTRMMFSLSRAGYASPALGKLSRRGVPVRALALSCIGIAVAMALSVLYPKASFSLMMSVSMFGAMFTWLMIFVTHYCFRRCWNATGGAPLAFRMRGFPVLTLLGAALMIATMITTYFTDEFRATLVTGIPFVVVLSVIYHLWYRKPAPR
ncbi:amino acid permease [Herbaspirillum sp. NPDC087042]|uniref:amino acid permease n=1 Tax=Herbaspirillum sp. NPDC087042 TaxID=3364004 RepID=UPI0038045FFA